MKNFARNEDETIRVAVSLAACLHAGDLVFLQGDLGAGKTVFARALIRALMDDSALEVPSPTFTLVQTYEGQDISVYHYDLYRIKDPEEIFELGWEEALSGAIVLVEWPERLGPYKVRPALDITLSCVENDPDAREILIERHDT